MSYYFKDVLDRNMVQTKIIDRGNDGHMGIIFKPYTKENLEIFDEIMDYFKNK